MSDKMSKKTNNMKRNETPNEKYAVQKVGQFRRFLAQVRTVYNLFMLQKKKQKLKRKRNKFIVILCMVALILIQFI